MAKFKMVIRSAEALRVDLGFNFRDRNNYDLDTMQSQILEHGGVHTPIWASKQADGSELVLRGNRRTLAAQRMLSDPSTPKEVIDNLKKLQVQLYEGLSKAEELDLLADHGQTKGLSSSEVVRAVWALAREGKKDGSIAIHLVYDLARYTGATNKLNELPKEMEGMSYVERMKVRNDRDERIKKWLHGTVGNYLLAVLKMPEYVRQQFMLAHRKQDGLLSKDEAGPEVNLLKRERIFALSKAKNEDLKASAWTEEGGPVFKSLLEKYKEEDAGPKQKADKVTPTVLKQLSEVLDSSALKDVLAFASNQKKDVSLSKLDEKLVRSERIEEVLKRHASRDNIDPRIKTLLNSLLADGSDVLDKLLESF